MIQNKRLLIIFLILSVSFNIFFILGYARSRHVIKTLKTSEGRTEFVAKKLKLTKDQKRVFNQLAKQFSIKKLHLAKDYSKETEAFWQEILKSNPDPQKVNAGLELNLAFKKKLNPIKRNFLLLFMKILTHEQKRLYVDMLRRTGGKF